MVRVAQNRDFVRAPKTGNPETDKSLEEISDDVNRLIRPLMRGQQSARLTTTASPQTLIVPHRLNRKYSGWLPVRVVGGTPTALHESADQPFPDRELRLDFTGTVGISLEIWVF